jgi:hypothetical protein
VLEVLEDPNNDYALLLLFCMLSLQTHLRIIYLNDKAEISEWKWETSDESRQEGDTKTFQTNISYLTFLLKSQK